MLVRRCGQYPLPVRGEFAGSCDDGWGSECLVTCSSGYRLIGSDTVTCEYDGASVYWHADETPTCEGKSYFWQVDTEMYNDNLSKYIWINHTLNYFSFDDIMDVFICYIVLCNILICLLYFLLKL